MHLRTWVNFFTAVLHEKAEGNARTNQILERELVPRRGGCHQVTNKDQ